ncbi:MAG: alpha/beta hydrolase [Bacteroidetes bacterium]|nr:alpha/beta hydrolase [Bacteroidota bacterium]
MKLAHYTYGAGPIKLIFLHGFCENNTCFNKQVLFFKDHYTVQTIDLPGFGSSLPTGTGTSMKSMAEAVLECLNLNPNEKVFLMGHSMGGYVGLELLKLIPNQIQGFGLIHSTPLADSEERKQKRKQVLAFIEKYGKQKYLESFFPGLFREGNYEPHKDFLLAEAMKSTEQGISEAVLAMMNREDNLAFLVNLEIPVFWGIGKEDALIAESSLFEMATQCKTSYIAYLKESAHMGMFEEAELLNWNLNQFFKTFSQG